MHCRAQYYPKLVLADLTCLYTKNNDKYKQQASLSAVRFQEAIEYLCDLAAHDPVTIGALGVLVRVVGPDCVEQVLAVCA